jgi:putative Holliday junction resolvase
MALDVGSKTVGVAISDPLRVTVRPLLTIRRRGLRADCREILDLCAQHGVERIVVGRPLRLDGAPGDSMQQVEQLAAYLQSRSALPIVWSDERLSSKEAEQLMAQARLRPVDRRRRRDEFAAAVILRRYLEESV